MQYSHFIVNGYVQGVGFREHARRQASKMGLKGWVLNRVDGTVEIFCKGERAVIDAFASWLRHGPPMARVDFVINETMSSDNSFYGELRLSDSFSIRF